jgi:hypothetical protein
MTARQQTDEEELRSYFPNPQPPSNCTLSSTRSLRVALTSVHPGCALHPVHPGCTSGYGDGTSGMVAGRRYGMCASFSAPARRQKRPAGGQTPVKAKNKLQQNCLARINHRSMELPLVSLSSQPSGFNSLQIRYVLIVFGFSFSPMPLKSVFSGSGRHASSLNDL